MKFRAKVGSFVNLAKLTAALSKLGTSCLVQLTPHNFTISLAPEGTDSSMVSCDLRQQLFFIEWKIESRAEDNRISFFCRLDCLHRAIKSVLSCTKKDGPPPVTTLKLSKKDGIPVLSFDIRIGEGDANVQHDVPLRLVQGPEETRLYSEPALDDTSDAVSVLLPPHEIKGLKNVVERMKTMSDKLRLTAIATVSRADFSAAAAASSSSDAPPVFPGAGRLLLEVRKDNQVTIRTTYPRLDFLQTGGADDMQTGATDDGGQAEAHDSDEMKKEAEATISIKRLSKVLQALVVSDVRLWLGVLCLVPGQFVVLKLFIQDQEKSSAPPRVKS